MAFDYFFSPSTKNFYPKELLPAYKTSGTLPEDVVGVSQEDYVAYTGTPPTNKTIGVVDGKPGWVDVFNDPSLAAQLERLWRNEELKRADICLYMVQDSDPTSVGSVSDWREYRKKLRAWPENPNFPNKDFRPKAPDYKE